jgi:hypothetical protein
MATPGNFRLHVYVIESGVELILDLKNKKEVALVQSHLYRMRGASGSIDRNHIALTKAEYDSLFDVLGQGAPDRSG